MVLLPLVLTQGACNTSWKYEAINHVIQTKSPGNVLCEWVHSPVMADLKNSFMTDMESFISGSVGCAGNISNLLKSASCREAGLMTQSPMLPPLETASGTETWGPWFVQGWWGFVFSVLVRVLGWQVIETELHNQAKLKKNKELIGS